MLLRQTRALRDGCTTFVHTKTVRLIVEEGMDINAIEIVRSLPDFKEEITGIVPNSTLYRRCNTLGHVWLRLWG